MQELFNKLRPLLSQPHPDLAKLQALRYELAEVRAQALQDLYETRPHLLRPKDRELTDLDRKTQMDGFCAEKEHDKQFLDDLWVIVNDLMHSDKD